MLLQLVACIACTRFNQLFHCAAGAAILPVAKLGRVTGMTLLLTCEASERSYELEIIPSPPCRPHVNFKLIQQHQ